MKTHVGRGSKKGRLDSRAMKGNHVIPQSNSDLLRTFQLGKRDIFLISLELLGILVNFC